jgi:hypothetical protein
MPSTTSLWRPALFGAAGTGFKDDAYLTEGQHLRWHVSGQLGLPFESAGRRVGAFRVRLTLLAPDVVEAILDGRQPADLQLDDLLEGVPFGWEVQRLLVIDRQPGVAAALEGWGERAQTW